MTADQFKTYFNISIHALVKRATKTVRTLYIPMMISIHALVKRATNKQKEGDIMVK